MPFLSIYNKQKKTVIFESKLLAFEDNKTTTVKTSLWRMLPNVFEDKEEIYSIIEKKGRPPTRVSFHPFFP